MTHSRGWRVQSFGFAASLCLALSAAGCSGTLDSLGASQGAAGAPQAGAPTTLGPLSGPSSYPNAFRDLAGRTDADIATKIATAFAQLFHGDPTTQAIYVPIGTDQAYVHDVYHDDIRTEGNGVAMLLAVELDKQSEFDHLWAYSKAAQEVTTGPARGYFNSVCDDATPCLDPYGMEQFVTALLFANDRWNGGAAGPYAADASALIDLLQNKERENGGVLAGTTSVFDPTSELVREQPTIASVGYTRSALEMPAFYDIWAQASGNAFWTGAAMAARAHLVAAANITTGLWPMRSYFDGTPVPNFDTYSAQGYRTQLNLATDALWGPSSQSEKDLADRVLAFFTAQGSANTGKTYKLDGTVLDPMHQPSLTAVNGALAIASSRVNRADFVNAVWAMPIPTGDTRYYDGMLYLVSLLVLSGEYRVY